MATTTFGGLLIINNIRAKQAAVAIHEIQNDPKINHVRPNKVPSNVVVSAKVLDPYSVRRNLYVIQPVAQVYLASCGN